MVVEERERKEIPGNKQKAKCEGKRRENSRPEITGEMIERAGRLLAGSTSC
jgi:hypothetical protein